jgi:hypothetical protein
MVKPPCILAQQDKEVFSIQPIDEQAPTIVSQYPAVDGFAVGRFADLSLVLADATGIDPASVRLTVGASGQMASGAPGLTISGNTITYDSGDAALGTWGATISATLVAADTLGHTLTHTWSFRLEPEPQTAANVFVFGSPTAQRAGQRVSGPAAALAPAPAGPQKVVESPPWSIHEVLADRIVIAYQAGGTPAFTAGQLVCNLAPAKESEIFYRRVLSTSDDSVNLKLTVFVPFSFDGLSFENSLGVKLEMEIEVLFLKSAGFAVTPDIGSGFKLAANPEDGLECWLELNSDVTVGAAGPLFKPVLKTLGVNTEVSWSLLDKEWKVWPTGGDLIFKSHPKPRTAEPGDVVSFRCNAEGPSDPTYQWYHNTKSIPGQISRTLTLYNVNTGHAGTYFVRAKAGGLTVDFNTATLTVQATTPENLDTDGDGIPNVHETNTGTWVSTTNRGTNPNHWDSDGDGLSDGVETNTRVYVSRSNTGTNPHAQDTDGDGVSDQREIDLGTNPNAAPVLPGEFALIPAGSFQMGDQSNPLVGYSGELPVHSVYVSAFYMGKYEVTKES